MFCKNCGAQISDTALFCEKCGTKVTASPRPADDATVNAEREIPVTSAPPVAPVTPVAPVAQPAPTAYAQTRSVLPPLPTQEPTTAKEYPFTIWKLVSGILSIILFIWVTFQSCALSVANSLAETGSDDATGGIIVALMLLAGGITSIAARKSVRGGNIALIVLFGFGALCGIGAHGEFMDLIVWGGWCAICAILALVSLLISCIPQFKDKNNDGKNIAFVVVAIVITVMLIGMLAIIYPANNP